MILNRHSFSNLAHLSSERIADAINWAHKETKSVIVVLENTAGAGNTLGRTFEELKEIIDRVDNKSRVGVCLDTCHMFAAGYDIRSPSVLHLFESPSRTCGLTVSGATGIC